MSGKDFWNSSINPKHHSLQKPLDECFWNVLYFYLKNKIHYYLQEFSIKIHELSLISFHLFHAL